MNDTFVQREQELMENYVGDINVKSLVRLEDCCTINLIFQTSSCLNYLEKFENCRIVFTFAQRENELCWYYPIENKEEAKKDYEEIIQLIEKQ